MNHLWIVVTDFNGFAQTKQCLEALRANLHQDANVIVVDHGTTTETRRGLDRDFPAIIRLPAPSHLWWTGATNVGIRRALSDGAGAIMLLNNDCYVTPNSITTLLALHQAHPEAIVAPLQRNIQTGELSNITPHTLFSLGFPTIPGPRRLTSEMTKAQILPVKLICGGRGVIIPRIVFEKIGLFDEIQLPHYWADHDFYLRAREAGLELYAAVDAIVNIDTSRTTMARDPGRLTFREFILSLQSIRSHRNVTHTKILFKKHFPIKPLYIIGVVLYTGRYFLVYLARRAWYFLRRIADRDATERP